MPRLVPTQYGVELISVSRWSLQLARNFAEGLAHITLLAVVVIIVIAATAINAYLAAATPFTREARNWVIADRDLGFIKVRLRRTLLI
jgi:hypothetical protein